MITSIKGLDPTLSPDVLSTLDRLESRYPVSYTIGVGWLPPNVDPDTQKVTHPIASTRPDVASITLNWRYWMHAEKLYDEMRYDVSFIAKTVGEVIIHEYAHVLAGKISRRIWAKAVRDLQNLVMGELKQLPSNTHYLRPEQFPLSVYAFNGGPIEAIAEAFVLAERGSDSPYAEVARTAFEGFRNDQ